MPIPPLARDERLHYRDRLRDARYGTLVDAEGFGQVCFVIEALGMRLLGRQAAIGHYKPVIHAQAKNSPVLFALANEFSGLFTRFGALYETVRRARNDAMHTGVYARHATQAAIELCIGLEEALMATQKASEEIVADLMVKAPVVVETWQPVAYARQLMLMHSFSFLPVYLDSWKLISEFAIAKYLPRDGNRETTLACRIDKAIKNGLQVIDAVVVKPTDHISDLLKKDAPNHLPALWLVSGSDNRLSGVLSPFELM